MQRFVVLSHIIVMLKMLYRWDQLIKDNQARIIDLLVSRHISVSDTRHIDEIVQATKEWQVPLLLDEHIRYLNSHPGDRRANLVRHKISFDEVCL